MRTDIAALVSSRICHDLISPLGAIGNGVELLELTSGVPSAEMSLISESVENANAKIRFFRIAYGTASSDQMVSRTEIVSVLKAAARGGRFTYFWETEGDQPRREVRLVFLMLQCIETACPMGGEVHISRTSDTWTIVANAPRLVINEALWTTLQAPRTPFDHSAAQVQFVLFPNALSDTRRKLSLAFEDLQITATF